MDDLLSTREAADLLGVSPTSVKRWADDGVIDCVRTAGQHRRFRRSVLEAFRRAPVPESVRAPAPTTWSPPAPDRRGVPAESWYEMLRACGDAHRVMAQLLLDRAELGLWWRVAERVAGVLQLIGQRWVAGELGILEEHAMSEALMRGLAGVGQQIAVPPGAPRCLLALVEKDEHQLGLALSELCVRAAGWQPIWAGRATPESELRRFMMTRSAQMVAISASNFSSDAQALALVAERLGLLAAREGIVLVLGGTGAWPDRVDGAERVHSFETFDLLLRRIREPSLAVRLARGEVP